MLIPVSEHDPLPSDVEELADKVRSEVSAPNLSLNIGSRRFSRSIPQISLADGDTLLEELDTAPRVGIAGQTEAPKLDYWTVRAHVYTREVAARVGLLAGLFGIGGKHASAGAVHEAKRFRIAKTEQGTPCEIGVAVRLIAATTEWGIDADISIPNIAAAVNLNAEVGDARIGIEVVGYSGPLGDLLPAPSKLDVSTLVDYVSAFNKVQRQVFGEAGLGFLTPAVINFEDPEARNDQ